MDATSPLRNQEDIEGAIKLLESGDSVTNVITGTNARRSPYFNLIELDKSGEVHLSGERKKWKEMLVTPDTSIKEALNVIERVEQIVFVIDLNGRLLGTVTDHDVRTSFLQGVKLDDAVKNIMNTNPITASNEMSEEDIRQNLRVPALNLDQDLLVSKKLPTTRVMIKDEDVCLHCGLCAERCPTGAWDMETYLYEEAKVY